jgi:predicted RNA-binding Zn ribbon-like protein
METADDVTRVRLVGGNLALDFVNTRSGPVGGEPDLDVLTGYSALIAWGVYAGALTKGEAKLSRRLARADPGEADAVFGRSLRARDDLDTVLGAVAGGGQPDSHAMLRLRDAEADAVAHGRLEDRGSFAWTWRDDRTLARPLRPAVHAGVDLLTSGELDRIKRCGGCRFLFYDESKNRSRRWCSMDDCGTTEKVRRYVAARRTRTASIGG